MTHLMVKKLLAFVAISVFFLGFCIQSVAALDNKQVKYDSVTNKIIVAQGNLFEGADNLFPGDTYARTLSFHNNSSSQVAFYMMANDSKDFANEADRKTSDELISLIKLKLELTSPDGSTKTLYNGSFSGKQQSNKTVTDNLISPVIIGKLTAHQSGIIRATITIPEKLNNRYQKVVGKINWLFYCDVYTGGGSDNPSSNPSNPSSNPSNPSSNPHNPPKPTDGDTPDIVTIDDPLVPLAGTKDLVNIIVDDVSLGKLPKTGGVTLSNTLLEPVNVVSVLLISVGLVLLISKKKQKKKNK